MNYSTEEMVKEMFNQSFLSGIFKVIAIIGGIVAILVCFFGLIWIFKNKETENGK